MSRTRNLTFAAIACLAFVGATGSVAAAPGGNGGSNGPTEEVVDVQLNLTGVATRTSGGPDAGFVFYINASGDATRRTPNGNGVQIRGNDLEAQITIIRTADNETVAQYTALVDFHAQQASSIAQGLDAGNFKFNMGLHGKRSESVVGIDVGTRVMAFNSNGSTIGPADDDGAHAVSGHGQTTLKDGTNGNSATHYNFELGGTGSILSQSA